MSWLKLSAANFGDHVLDTPLHAILDYWRRLAPGKALPSRADIAPQDLGPDLKHVVMQDVERTPAGLEFRYRLVGTGIVDGFGSDATGRRLAAAIPGRSSAFIRSVFADVVETRAAHYYETTLYDDGEAHVTYHRVVMPLSDDGRTVNILFGGLCFNWQHPVRKPFADLSKVRLGRLASLRCPLFDLRAAHAPTFTAAAA